MTEKNPEVIADRKLDIGFSTVSWQCLEGGDAIFKRDRESLATLWWESGTLIGCFITSAACAQGE